MYQTDFDRYFAKRMGDRLPARFLAIFSVVLFATVLVIVFLGTYNYPALQPHVRQAIQQRFQSLILEQEPKAEKRIQKEDTRTELAAGAREIWH